jgi:hypothetical protein
MEKIICFFVPALVIMSEISFSLIDLIYLFLLPIHVQRIVISHFTFFCGSNSYGGDIMYPKVYKNADIKCSYRASKLC